MTLLREQPYRYPYTLHQLGLDEPSRSFSSNPSDDELLVYTVYRVQPTQQPEFDPYQQKVVEADPVKSGTVYFQSWNIVPLTDEERDLYFRQQNPPDYKTFWLSLPSEVNTLLEQAPKIVEHSLSNGLSMAEQNDCETFLIAWNQAKQEGLVTQALNDQIIALAQQNNFYPEVINAL